jgi:hypothetical protein
VLKDSSTLLRPAPMLLLNRHTTAIFAIDTRW